MVSPVITLVSPVTERLGFADLVRRLWSEAPRRDRERLLFTDLRPELRAEKIGAIRLPRADGSRLRLTEYFSTLACDSTIGSLSTYTTRDSGAIACATSWVLPAAGRPVPMSRNWRIPASAARNSTARPRKARLARTERDIFGSFFSASSAAARSAAKLSFPPSQ
jgi:hypothetical protein